MSAVIVAADGRYLDADDDALRLLGLTMEALHRYSVGDFSGPLASVVRMVWRRYTRTGRTIPLAEATLHLPDGSEVRVRYTRIDRLANGRYELQLEPADDSGDVPVVARPAEILAEWRAAEREAALVGGPAAAEAEALRALYHLAAAKLHEPLRRARSA